MHFPDCIVPSTTPPVTIYHGDIYVLDGTCNKKQCSNGAIVDQGSVTTIISHVTIYVQKR